MNKIDQPLVSVLIPTYNSGRFVAEAIESALAQTYESVEIVISDNDSTDDTLAIAQGYAADHRNLTISKNVSNQGPVRNWRRCAESAKGEFAVLLFSDDRLAPDFVASMLPYLSDPNVAFAYSAVGRIDQDSRESPTAPLYQLPASGVYPIKQFIEGHLLLGEDIYPLSPGCGLFRTKDLKHNLDTELPDELGAGFMGHGGGPDLNVYLQCGSKYASFGYEAERKAFFRGHEGNLSRLDKVNLAYALAKAWFAAMYYPQGESEGLKHFRAAHYWRLARLGQTGLYKKSMAWDRHPWHMAYLDWAVYLLNKIIRKMHGKN